MGGISPAWGAVFVLVYVVLDWISYINLAGQLPITPWNPFTGLAFALAIINGPGFAIWWVLGLCAADIVVRGSPIPFLAEAIVSISIATTYCVGAWFLSAPKLGFSYQLATWRSVASLVAVGALCTIVASVISVAVLTLMDSLNTGDATRALIRHFVGDLIGILVITPFVLIRDQLVRLASKMTLEHALIAISTMGIIWLVTIFDGRVRLYLLFLPVIWCAVRFGLPGAVAILVLVQISLIVALRYIGATGGEVTADQGRMIMLTITGLATGVLVDERSRMESALRHNREALESALRSSTVGELGAALAHELNQPLQAVANFVRLSQNAMRAKPPDMTLAMDAGTKALEQVERASNVVRRLREFIRSGHSELAPEHLHTLVNRSIDMVQAASNNHGVTYDVKLPPDLPMVLVDGLQIQQVLVNLLRNAVEALQSCGRAGGRVTVEATTNPCGNSLLVRVADDGPGFDPEILEQLGTPFTTSKPLGMGLGLSLSRSIIEANGGEFSILRPQYGAEITFTLPIVQDHERAQVL